MSKPNFIISDAADQPPATPTVAPSEKALMIAIGVSVLVQLWLVFVKGINWDEFLHFGHIYDLSEGRLTSALQTILTRLAAWTTMVTGGVIHQIQAARLFMLASEIGIILLVVALARQFAGRQAALLSGLVYVTGGFIFTQAFSYRPDPVSAALLMGSLYLFAQKGLSWKRALAIGFLIGLAGALTIKSVFYAPCFAGYAWLRLREPSQRTARELLPLALIPLSALIFFAVLIALHSTGIVRPENQAAGIAMRTDEFIGSGLFQKARYVVMQAWLAPLITLGLVILPFVARRRKKGEKILLVALTAPLLCLIFYRNTFPYFFTFLLPPICVAIVVVLEKLIARYRLLPVALLSLFGPAYLLANESYEVLGRQRATIAEVERLFPEPTGYLAYSSYVPHYPRQFGSLISGVALKLYWAGGEHPIADNIRAGHIAFIVVSGDALEAIYNPNNKIVFLPREETSLLQTNFLKYVGNIRILGKTICANPAPQNVEIYRPGPYALGGGAIEIDGNMVSDGGTIMLSAGPKKIVYRTGPCVKLWALGHVPHPPAGFPEGPLGGNF